MSRQLPEFAEGPECGVRTEGLREDLVTIPPGMFTVLLADVEGSVALWESDREAAAEGLSRRLVEIVTEVVERRRGIRPLEQGEGDSFLVAFARPSDAAACALELQIAFAKEAWPTDSPVLVRMAIHTGEMEVRDDGRYVGHALNRCARIRALAHGGQVLISGASHGLMVDSLPSDATLKDLGEHRLRDLDRPERIYQLCHPDLPLEFPPLRSLSALPNNLPLQLTTLIGRETEIEEAKVLLDGTRMLTLTGAGGCGKTRLAIHIGAELLDQFSDGVWWVDLAPTSDPVLVPSIVARTLRVREVRTETITETLVRSLQNHRLLLILDNCEHLVAACADLASALLRNCPATSILATSREPLGIEGETSFRVPSLPFAESDPSTPEQLLAYDSARLFFERAIRARPSFKVTLENMADIALICRRLDGIPLAIELAAARLRALSPARIGRQLSDRFHLLTGGARTALPRQRTLEASVDWSYRLLNDEERLLLARLSVFAGSFDLEAAEGVGASGAIDPYAVLDLLASLADRSLVQVEESSGDLRYRLLETIRFYARQRLAESGESDDVRTRHLDYYVALAERVEPKTGGAVLRAPGADEFRGRLASDLDDLRAALDWAITSGQADKHLRISGLDSYWDVQPPSRDARKSVKAALAVVGGDPHLRARALVTASVVLVSAGESGTARKFIAEAATLAQELGDPRLQHRALGLLGFIEFWWEGLGVEKLSEAVHLARETGDLTLLVPPLMHLAAGQTLMYGLGAGMPTYEEARALGESIGHERALAFGSFLVGAVAGLGGHLDDAHRLLLRSIELSPSHALARMHLGLVEACRGNFSAAQQFLNDGYSLVADEDRAAHAMMNLHNARAMCARAIGELDSAAAGAEEALALSREEDLKWTIVWSLWVLGAVEVDRGDLKRAGALLEEARDLGRLPAFPFVLGRTLHHSGRLARARNDLAHAEDLQHEALAIMTRLGDLSGTAETLEELGGLATALESYLEATRLLGAAERLREEIGYVRFPIDRPAWEADRSAALAALGEEEFHDAWSEGAALTLQEAVLYAQRGRGERKRPSSGWASLTPAELEVVKLVAQGLSNPEIAKRLFIARNTVKVHLSHVFTKLGLSTRAELASDATRQGV